MGKAARIKREKRRRCDAGEHDATPTAFRASKVVDGVRVDLGSTIRMVCKVCGAVKLGDGERVERPTIRRFVQAGATLIDSDTGERSRVVDASPELERV